MNVAELIERARVNGLTVSFRDGGIEVSAADEPQGETLALIQELREHKVEILEALAGGNPTLPLEVDRCTNQAAAPPCQICAATMTEATDIFGCELWVCWNCAKEA